MVTGRVTRNSAMVGKELRAEAKGLIKNYCSQYKQNPQSALQKLCYPQTCIDMAQCTNLANTHEKSIGYSTRLKQLSDLLAEAKPKPIKLNC